MIVKKSSVDAAHSPEETSGCRVTMKQKGQKKQSREAIVFLQYPGNLSSKLKKINKKLNKRKGKNQA